MRGRVEGKKGQKIKRKEDKIPVLVTGDIRHGGTFSSLLKVLLQLALLLQHL
jgi:aspartate carbamoyltransferase catalytic subunit